MNRCFSLWLCSLCYSLGLLFSTSIYAQQQSPKPSLLAGTTEIRPDSLDFYKFPTPRDVVTFGVGIWGLYKGTINTFFTTDYPSTLPTFNLGNRTATLDVQPTLDFGVTLYSPMLFGEKIGLNLDIGLSRYNYGTLYNTNFIFTDAAADNLRATIRQQAATNPDTVQKYLTPKYFTTLQYITVAPLLNLGGFLLGANIGIPLGDASIETPTNKPLGMSASSLTIPQNLLNLFIEPRIGVQVPVLSIRAGTLFLNANISYTAFGSPLSDEAALISDRHIRGVLDSFPLPASVQRYRFSETTAALGRTATIDTLRVRPLSASIGLSFLISVGNNHEQVDEILREERRSDSLRLANANITRHLDSLRQRSIGLADKAINTIIESSKISDKIASLEKAQLEKQKVVLSTQLTETKKKVFQALIGAITGTNDDGTETAENPTIRIEQFQSKAYKALLPKVFFEQNSAVLSSRYRRIQTAERESYKIPSDPLASSASLYPHLLNIIGKRLVSSSSKLTLTGFQSADEGDTKLAEKRVETVALYFQDVWRIPASRITRTLSKAPATGNASEARRVDISADAADITAPLQFDYTARLANPPVVNIGLDISTGSGLKQWELEIQQLVDNQGVVLKDTTGGAVYPPRFMWRLNEEPGTIPQSNEPVTIRIGAYDLNNAAAPDSPLKTLRVEQITMEQKRARKLADKSMQHFECLFGTSLAEMEEPSRRVMEAAKAVITPQSKVFITVYGGTASVSARSVAEMLNLDAKSAVLRDAAAAPLPTQSPEGAAYSRSIRIRVESPAN